MPKRAPLRIGNDAFKGGYRGPAAHIAGRTAQGLDHDRLVHLVAYDKTWDLTAGDSNPRVRLIAVCSPDIDRVAQDRWRQVNPD